MTRPRRTFAGRPGPGAAAGRALRLVAGNAVVLLGLLLCVGAVGEVVLRLGGAPFVANRFPMRFVPGVGVLGEPHTEVRWTDERDFRTISRTNRLGFLDREPPPADEPAKGCRLTLIGDSFVEAKQVALAEKVQLRLEELAARDLPEAALTASAFGLGGTGQVAQLALYDRYARKTGPQVVVLAVYWNDFADNSAAVTAADRGFDPERMPVVTAVRGAGGAFHLRPPHPEALRDRWQRSAGLSGALAGRLRAGWEEIRGVSFLLDWLHGRAVLALGARVAANRSARGEALGRDPRYETALAGLPPEAARQDLPLVLARELGEPEAERSPAAREAVAATAFALDEFRTRAARDEAVLVLFATHALREFPGPFETLTALASERGLPVVDQYDYIVRRKGRERLPEAEYPNDGHWTPLGHRWAAEALLEYLREHPEVCGGAAGAEPGS